MPSGEMSDSGHQEPVDWDAAQARRRLAHALRIAAVSRERAAESKLNLWHERLLDRMPHGRDGLLDCAVEAAISLASADFADIQLVHPRPGGLILAAQRGLQAPFLDFFHFVSDGNTACGLAFKNRCSIDVDDITNSPIYSYQPAVEVLLDAGVNAVKSVPLIDSKHRMLGVLSVLYSQPRHHRANDLVRLQSLATMVADLLNGSPPSYEGCRTA